MDVLEIIAIRCGGLDGKEKVREALKTIEEIQGTEGLMGIRMYCNASLETDLSIHIHWNAETRDQSKSPLGLKLTQALRYIGLINHSVWIEGRE